MILKHKYRYKKLNTQIYNVVKNYNKIHVSSYHYSYAMTINLRNRMITTATVMAIAVVF